MNKEMFFKMFKNKNYIDQLKEIPQKFNVKHNEEEKKTEITIYGVIGDSWWSDSFSANDIDKALNEAGDNDVVINLNSPGGDAFDGISIFNRLKRHKGKVTVHVDGWACSAASIIAMAGDEIIMELGSMMMIHEASNIVWGSKTDMRKEADVLEQLEEGIIDIYVTKANIGRDEIKEKVNAETWFSASSAVELGLAHKAEGVEETPKIEMTAEKNDDRKSILNELKNVLEPNNQTEQEPSENKGSFNLFKKWR
ncbi:head maturation protease, ClpP-related [Virgibacillus pantothenticus]|uniref:head maturation protease, ClpP-related n=1 Tax=Virgibacillus pantothenticus TaxID=1473 RepID=UPI003D29E15A